MIGKSIYKLFIFTELFNYIFLKQRNWGTKIFKALEISWLYIEEFHNTIDLKMLYRYFI